MKSIKIIEQNPQTEPESIPGFRSHRKFESTSGIVMVFQTMAVERNIPAHSGQVLIVDEGRGRQAASRLTLAAPARRSAHDAGENGARLEIISTCAYEHTITTPARAINGEFGVIKFDALGSVRLYAHDGQWIVLSSSGVSLS